VDVVVLSCAAMLAHASGPKDGELWGNSSDTGQEGPLTGMSSSKHEPILGVCRWMPGPMYRDGPSRNAPFASACPGDEQHARGGSNRAGKERDNQDYSRSEQEGDHEGRGQGEGKGRQRCHRYPIVGTPCPIG
jgi:hypothetical protein